MTEVQKNSSAGTGLIALAKAVSVRLFSTAGISRFILESRWRRERLVILCYHGLALEDEHHWNPSLYMSPALFRARLEIIRDHRCNVLSLPEAMDRLDAGTLPPRSVAITFDDGGYDFYTLAWPLLREFGFPVTLYFTSWYSQFNRPVFDVMCGYLLWKARDRTLVWPEVAGPAVALSTPHARLDAEMRIKLYARENGLSGRAKDALLSSLAGRLNIDYEALCRKRLLHIMTEEEATEVARQGVDFELHTHRHRVFLEEPPFAKEIADNRAFISHLTGAAAARHFCYPDGFWVPQFAEFLKHQSVKTATTCQPGIVSRDTDRWLLPRMVDSSNVSENEFAMWLSGIAALLPRRSQPIDGSEVLLETAPVTDAVAHVPH